MHETLGQYALLKEDIEKLQKETESTRLILSYDICEAVTATKKEVVNVKNEISTGPPVKDQIQALTEELKLLRGNIDSLLKQARQESDTTHLVEELRELRQAVNENSLRREPAQPPCSVSIQDSRDQESAREQQHSQKTELNQQVADLRMQLNAEVAEIRQDITTMSQDIKELTTASSNSPLLSVLANLEELRRENRELRDITVDSVAPIRLAIESLRKELKNQSHTGEVDLAEYKCQSQEHYLTDQEQKYHLTAHKYRTPPLTFSEVLRKPHYPILVESIDPRSTSEDIIKQVRGGIDVVELGIGVSNIKKAKNQKVLISCESEKDRNILQDKLKSTTANLTAYRPSTKNPLLRLIGVVFDLTDNKVEEAIIKQNRALLHDVPMSQLHVKVIRRTKGRTSSIINVVLEVSPQVWNKIKDQKIRIGFQVVPAIDQSPIIQCYRCLGFSHRAWECKAQKMNCGYCAEAHDTRECSNKNKTPKCTNCTDKRQSETNCAHPAYSPECPEWRKWDRIARSTVTYC